jgi:hypothetical protein
MKCIVCKGTGYSIDRLDAKIVFDKCNFCSFGLIVAITTVSFRQGGKFFNTLIESPSVNYLGPNRVGKLIPAIELKKGTPISNLYLNSDFGQYINQPDKEEIKNKIKIKTVKARVDLFSFNNKITFEKIFNKIKEEQRNEILASKQIDEQVKSLILDRKLTFSFIYEACAGGGNILTLG